MNCAWAEKQTSFKLVKCVKPISPLMQGTLRLLAVKHLDLKSSEERNCSQTPLLLGTTGVLQFSFNKGRHKSFCDAWLYMASHSVCNLEMPGMYWNNTRIRLPPRVRPLVRCQCWDNTVTCSPDYEVIHPPPEKPWSPVKANRGIEKESFLFFHCFHIKRH